MVLIYVAKNCPGNGFCIVTMNEPNLIFNFSFFFFFLLLFLLLCSCHAESFPCFLFFLTFTHLTFTSILNPFSINTHSLIILLRKETFDTFLESPHIPFQTSNTISIQIISISLKCHKSLRHFTFHPFWLLKDNWLLNHFYLLVLETGPRVLVYGG